MCIILSTRDNAYNWQINRTLNSIYNQHHQNYQVVIADRASRDNTPSIIQDYLSKNSQAALRTQLLQMDMES